MVNNVELIGRLTRDPEIKTFESGSKIGKVSLATSKNRKNKNSGDWEEITQFHNVVVYGKAADKVDTLEKGDLVRFTGELEHRKYQDSQGNDKYISEVVCTFYQRIVRSKANQDRASSNQTQNNAPRREANIDEW